jgi:hypothetical protein
MIVVRRGFLTVAAGTMLAAICSAPASAHTVRCDPCCQACCEPPPPVELTVCLQDPCTCCSEDVELCIPAECAGEAPQVSWRWGLFGRRIAELCWPCCDFSVEVVFTRHGRVIVR